MEIIDDYLGFAAPVFAIIIAIITLIGVIGVKSAVNETKAEAIKATSISIAGMVVVVFLVGFLTAMLFTFAN